MKIDRDYAKKYINYGIESFRIKKRTCAIILFASLCLFLISNLIYQNIILFSLCLFLVVFNVIILSVSFFKWCLYKRFLLFAVNVLFIIIAINILYFSIAKANAIFSLLDYLLSILAQIVIIVPIFWIIKKLSVKIMLNRIPFCATALSGLFAGFSITGYTLAKYFLSKFSADVGIFVGLISIQTLPFLLMFMVIGFGYKGLLAKKFNIIEFEIDNNNTAGKDEGTVT